MSYSETNMIISSSPWWDKDDCSPNRRYSFFADLSKRSSSILDEGFSSSLNLFHKWKSNEKGNVKKKKPPILVEDLEPEILLGHTKKITCLASNPTRNITATGSLDCSVFLWNTKGSMTTYKRLDHKKLGSQVQAEHPVTALDWNRAGSLLASGTEEGFVRVWDACGNLQFLKREANKITCLKWNKSGSFLFGGLVDGSCIAWKFSNGKLETHQTFQPKESSISTIQSNAENTFVASTLEENIHVFKLGCKKALRTFSGAKTRLVPIQWDLQENVLALSSASNTIKVFHIHREDYSVKLKGHSQAVFQVKLSNIAIGTTHQKNRLILASGSLDQTVKLWDVESGTCFQTITMHRSSAKSFEFSPDGRLLASCSVNDKLIIWCPKTKQFKSHQFPGFKASGLLSWNSTGYYQYNL
jgi:transducin (beta)-like 1